MTAGRMVYCMSYPIPKYRREDTPRQRGEKRRASGSWQAKLNRLKSSEKLEQLIYCNFGPGDWFLTLTYRDGCLPARRARVMEDVRAFRRRLSELRRQRGAPLCYIYTMEHKSSGGRWHVHMVLRGTGPADLQEIRESWRKGHVHAQRFELGQGEALAAYLAKEAPDYVGEHPWIASRGLRRPKVDSRLVSDADRLAVPPGAVIRTQESRTNSYGRFEYVKYFLPQL